MQKNKNRQGLALGAVFALVASALVITSPAQAVDQSSVVVAPNGTATQTVMLHGEAFDLDLSFGTGVDSSYRDFQTATNALFGITVTKPAGTSVSAIVTGAGASSSSEARDAAANPGGNTSGAGSASSAVETAGTEAVFVTNASGSPVVGLSLPDGTSVSASVAITVTPFLDVNADGVKQASEPNGDPITITFVPLSYMTATIAVEQPLAGTTYGVTGSFAVTATDINYDQLDSDFVVTVTRSGSLTSVSSGVSGSSIADATAASTSVGIDGGVTTSARAYSVSFEVAGPAFTESHTISANVMYGGVVFKTSSTVTVTTVVIAGITLSAVTGDNSFQTTGGNATDGTADVRINSAFTLDAYAWTVSDTQSVAIDTALTVSAATVIFDADSGVILNGTTYTQSATFLAAGFTLASGTETVAVSTFGQASATSMTLTLEAQGFSTDLTITVKGANQSVSFTSTTVSGLAGTAKSFALTAYDQWGAASARTDQRIAGSAVLSGSTSTTVSAVVVAGEATVAVTPSPATRTGSAVVTFTLQQFNQSTQNWDDVAGTATTVAWNVYSYTAGTDAFTSNFVSASASISYVATAGFTWSEIVTVEVLNSFSDVVVSAPGLMIQNSDETTVTASDTLTVNANGQAVNLKFTSLLAGTYTVTYTTGDATTTSEIVVDVAAHDAGATLTFDKTTIAAGTTTTITGTLLDLNGNPVMTSGSSDVSVAWSGKGLPFGNATDMETDASGELTFYVLVLSGEKGDGAISATYKPAGATVDTDNITVVQAVGVGQAIASADQKITIGTYKGYVGVFTKGYEGQKLSVRLASKWHVRNPIVDLNAGYSLLTVNTGVGYVANVIVYIDGVEVKRETITTK